VEAGICMVLSTAMVLPASLLPIYVVDTVIGDGHTEALHIVCIVLAAVTLLGLCVGFIQRYLLILFTRRVFFALETGLFGKVHSLPISFFRQHGSGYISSRIRDDVRQLGSLMAGTYVEGLSGLSLLLAALIVMFLIHPFLASMVVVIVPALVVVNIYFGRLLRRLSQDVQECEGLTNAVRLESLEAVPAARAFGRAKAETIRLARVLHREADARLRADIAVNQAVVSHLLLYGMGGLLLLWVGSSEIIAGRLSLGQFVTFNALMTQAYGPAAQLSGLYVGVQRGLGVLKRIAEIIDAPPEASGEAGTASTRTARLRFENVCFSYGSAPVLRNLNLTLNPGEITAVVGPTGAGKTTIAYLLLRYCSPHSGAILLGAENIANTDIRSYRSQLGWVDQELRFFSGTIRENIAYGCHRASSSEIERAAEEMNCMGFIEDFPQGLDTRIGVGGIQLSGGQKQRLALARATVRDPTVLILDEATSSLDSASESLVHNALIKASAGRTTLLIAHNAATISIATHVAVLVGGSIIEEGTPEELHRESGYFGRLCAKQHSPPGGEV
jgi:ABC-type multidrug transport system fused ATPase/permease subunit